MKKVLIIGALIIVLIVVGIVTLVSNIDSLVAKGIEKYGSKATQTAVTVSGVKISLGEGRGSIKGLLVESPERFDVRDAFSLGDITVDIDIPSLRGDLVIIEEIRVRAPVVNVQATETGATNIDELRKNIEASIGEKTEGSDKSNGKTKKIRIMKFVFEKGRIEVDASALGVEKRSLVLPEIRLEDIGGADGATPEEISGIVLSAVAKKVASEVTSSGIEELIKDKLGDSSTEKAKSILDKIGD